MRYGSFPQWNSLLTSKTFARINGIIKETGFEENNQKIGDCDYFNENGMKHKTESWMLDSEGQSFIYSSINYIN